MSVIVAKRNKSPIQFVDDSRMIADIIASRMEHFLNKISKKYTTLKYIANRINSYYYEAPVKYAIEAYICVTYANRIYIKDEKSLERRRNQLDNAIEYYNKLSSVISILFGKFKSSFNQNAIINIIDLINNEVEQIKNIIQNDKNRIK